MAIAGINHLRFHLLILMSILAISRADNPGDCVYTFYIKTGSVPFAGTDSKVTVTFSDRNGNKVEIRNIETWGGKMGRGYNYFENGQLDTFSGKAKCLPGPICKLTLSLDWSLILPAWYPSYLNLTTTGDKKPCFQIEFPVNQWMFPPLISSVTKNLCGRKATVMEDSDVSNSGWPSFVADGIAY